VKSFLPNTGRFIISRKMRRGGYAACMERKSNACWVLVGKLEWNIAVEWPTQVYGDNIKIDLKETWWGGTNWICLAQNREKWLGL
jgi:hypothetical protein